VACPRDEVWAGGEATGIVCRHTAQHAAAPAGVKQELEQVLWLDLISKHTHNKCELNFNYALPLRINPTFNIGGCAWMAVLSVSLAS
jgi:hypothetical protein